ncbi:MAG: hypothetical protein RLN82_03165, partial [Pseudomonadales bacterium]
YTYLVGCTIFQEILNGKGDEALIDVNSQLDFHKDRPIALVDSFVRIWHSAIALLNGNLSVGMRDLIKATQYQDECKERTMYVVCNHMIANMHLQMAEGEIQLPGIPTLIRNPGFVIRHALPAKKQAKHYLEKFRAGVEQYNVRSKHAWLAFLTARLALLNGNMDEARREFDKCSDILQAGGRKALPSRVEKLGKLLHS